MGYTHYFENFKTLPIEAVESISKLLSDYSYLIQLESGNESAPICTANEIRFNGIGDDGHETFLCNGSDWNFCKTAQKPYDVVVVAVLYLIAHYLDDFKWSSDGDVFELFDGLALAKKYI